MFFRFSRVHVEEALSGRQSSGLCVVDVQLAAVVLATDPTAGIQSTNYTSCLGSATADDDRDRDLLSGLCGPAGSLSYQELLLTLEEEARRKILAKTRRLRCGLRHQLDHARSPQPHRESRSATPKSLAPQAKG